jgi:hypothetical protein
MDMNNAIALTDLAHAHYIAAVIDGLLDGLEALCG